MSPAVPFATISGVQLEYRLLEENQPGPTLVFLHEGLGSVDLWKDFPREVAQAVGSPALVYSRRGYGRSDPLDSPRSPHFLHDEATITLPLLLDELDVEDPILIGHSDGASISLIYAGSFPGVRGVVAMAPHVFVEPEAQSAARALEEDFLSGDMAEKMSRYHRDPAATFYGWFDIWRSPGFRDWNIEDALEKITCPVLVIQGEDDEYGTVAQVEAVDSGIPGHVQRLWLKDCGHSPHRDRPDEVRSAIVDFVKRVGPS
ncbi:MAG: alpha/beta hydrolase [Acidimicrobiia bacterium]